MKHAKRVFIFGAGFSKPAKMPLATELLPLLVQKVHHEEMQSWLDYLRQRLAWLAGDGTQFSSFGMNIEEVFHCAHFDAETQRLM
jgi:hypothetical protein